MKEKEFKVKKSYKEINDKIKKGEVVVVNAQEMIDIVKDKGPEDAAKKVDIVTTGTFAPMCSSGAFFNFGHSKPGVKAYKTWLNKVRVGGGVAAVDGYLGATSVKENDPLNSVYPGDFSYGGGHVIEDLLLGKEVDLEIEGYGTDCYPNKSDKRKIKLENIPYALLCNPRNAYQNYNCAINMGNKMIYTYLGILKPKCGNMNYSSAGELSPLFNDPYYEVIGLGTKIFLGGGVGFVSWFGTQHNPNQERNEFGVPVKPAGTLFVAGDLKGMSAKWIKGLSVRGYGVSLAVGIGVPIPVLNEKIALQTGIEDKNIFTQIVDYSSDYPSGISKSYGQVSYAELKSGFVDFEGQKIPTTPLSSRMKALEICEILKKKIKDKKFFLTESQRFETLTEK